MYDYEYIKNKVNIPLSILDEIDSSNEEAKRRIKSGEKDDFVIVARKQTAGKGRKGRSFYSPKDTGIYLTFTHFTSSSVEESLSVTIASSVIVYRVLKEVLGTDCKIKWVNDLYFCERKVCGILCEWAMGNESEGICNAVVTGIGINISTEDFPDEIRQKAGCLINEKTVFENESRDNKDYPERKGSYADEIVSGIINGLKNFFNENNLSLYMDDYRKNSMVLGRKVELSGAEGVFAKGLASAFTDKGELVITMDDGTKRNVDSGEISLIFAD
ncbi:MAG: biotin--[acetyl-CoA-carboxylase] ligase [Lachnospiraceae bacterium]|nr:biotin--[acetyl-CoA-carboxylase] ligase [Lachnospiraceae bacterium]